MAKEILWSAIRTTSFPLWKVVKNHDAVDKTLAFSQEPEGKRGQRKEPGLVCRKFRFEARIRKKRGRRG